MKCRVQAPSYDGPKEATALVRCRRLCGSFGIESDRIPPLRSGAKRRQETGLRPHINAGSPIYGGETATQQADIGLEHFLRYHRSRIPNQTALKCKVSHRIGNGLYRLFVRDRREWREERTRGSE